jgi:transcriptional regulator GlxA family with amidase domain
LIVGFPNSFSQPIARARVNRRASSLRIADSIACNADYLGRAFWAAFNETPTDHIHRLRIDRARVLLRSANHSIERVGAEVGFSDERYFRRIFRRRVGLTPGQFQRLHAPRGEKAAER